MPFGTGNDFTKVMGFAKDVEGAADTILNGTVKNADAAEVNGRPFINVAGLGFDVATLIATEKYKAKYNGMFPYILGIMDALSHLKTMPLTIEHDGVTEKCDSIIMSVGNGQYIGGGMRVAPEAEMDDGMFDVVVVRKVPRMCIPFLLPLFMLGWHTKLGLARVMRAKRVSLRAKGMTLNVDGKLVTADHADYELLPGAIRMMRP